MGTFFQLLLTMISASPIAHGFTNQMILPTTKSLSRRVVKEPFFPTRKFLAFSNDDLIEEMNAPDTTVDSSPSEAPVDLKLAIEAAEIPESADRNKNPLKREVATPLRTSSTPGTLTIPKDVAMDQSKDVATPKEEKSYSIETILKELQAIQNTGPRKYVILGTRHGSFMHQQIIELLSYALVLTGNHIFTSGSPGTNAAAIRGALRAERPELLTVVLPQSLSKQPQESQDLLTQVEDVIENPMNDGMSLDLASRLCNSDLLSRADSLIAFAFHDSNTVIEATKEAKSLDMVVTVLYLD